MRIDKFTNQYKIEKDVINGYKSRFIDQKLLLLKELLNNFDITNYLINRRRNFSLCKDLIDSFISSGLFLRVSQYDLFRTLRLDLSEIDISNIFSSILNPVKSPWGKEILIEIMKFVRKETKIKKVDNFMSLLKITPDGRFYLKREWRGAKSRIDIRVISRNPDPNKNVIIDFEIKLEGGYETNVDGLWQTQREWDDLKHLATKENIPTKNVIAFYITPLGNKSKSLHFIPLSWDKLRHIIINKLEVGEFKRDSIFTNESVGALHHFFKSSWIF